MSNQHLVLIFSLLIVTEVTLFFNDEHLHPAIGLTLTVMLVMYTMYQSILDSMTKTAYLKLLDYWLLFCLLMPFTTFVTEVYWLLRPKAISSIKSGVRQRFLKRVFRKRFMQIAIPLFTVLFIVLYFIAATVIKAAAD